MKKSSIFVCQKNNNRGLKGKEINVFTDGNHWMEIWIDLFESDKSSVTVIFAMLKIASRISWSLIIPGNNMFLFA